MYCRFTKVLHSAFIISFPQLEADYSDLGTSSFRYQNCISVLMQTNDVNTEIQRAYQKHPCVICCLSDSSAISLNDHATLCLVIQAFYLRMALDASGRSEACEQRGCCDITPTSRSCRSCRYQRCLAVGMCRRGTLYLVTNSLHVCYLLLTCVLFVFQKIS